MYKVDKEDLRKIIMELSVLRCRIQDHQEAAQKEYDKIQISGQKNYNRAENIYNNVLSFEDAADYIQSVIDELKNVK